MFHLYYPYSADFYETLKDGEGYYLSYNAIQSNGTSTKRLRNEQITLLKGIMENEKTAANIAKEILDINV